MKKRLLLVLIILLAGTLRASDSLFFKVTILGIPCAGVELIEHEIDQNVNEIIYHAFTVGAFDNIYQIDNWYYYYTDSGYTHLDSLKKDITNRKMHQIYKENIDNDQIRYSTGSTLNISMPVHHVLSSLSFLMHHPEHIKSGYEFPYQITDEGDLYKLDMHVIKNEKLCQDEAYFTTTHIKGHEVLEPTDVFNWMICAGKGQKLIVFSQKDHTITEAAFSLGWGLHLRAKRIN